MSPALVVVAALGCAFPTPPLHAAPATPTVEIDAGPYERYNATVTFTPPPGTPPPPALTRNGQTYPAQRHSNGVVAVTIPHLAANERARFDWAAASPHADGPDRTKAGIKVRRDGPRLAIERINPTSKPGQQPARQPLFAYQAEPGDFPRTNIKEAFRRGGYLHPIHAPNGSVVTDDFPPNHLHHHGVWWAWTKTVFQGRQPDFWNMGDGTGRVEFEAVDATWSGPVHGGFTARHRFVDLKAEPAKVALEEAWTITTYAAPADATGAWMFDLVSEQHCATGDALRLPEYRYGGVGLRGNWAWNGRTNVTFLTSEGITDRVAGNATRGRWCDMSGDVDGRRVGIAILGHPGNFRAPQPMRLHPDEPFFNFAPQQAGDMSIEPGTTFVARYRFVVHDGPPDAAALNRLWNDFAHPPTVKFLPADPAANR